MVVIYICCMKALCFLTSLLRQKANGRGKWTGVDEFYRAQVKFTFYKKTDCLSTQVFKVWMEKRNFIPEINFTNFYFCHLVNFISYSRDIKFRKIEITYKYFFFLRKKYIRFFWELKFIRFWKVFGFKKLKLKSSLFKIMWEVLE